MLLNPTRPAQARADVEAARSAADARASSAIHAAKAAHAVARTEWEAELEARVTARSAEATVRLAAESAGRRAAEIEVVVARLSNEMAAAAKVGHALGLAGCTRSLRLLIH